MGCIGGGGGGGGGGPHERFQHTARALTNTRPLAR